MRSHKIPWHGSLHARDSCKSARKCPRHDMVEHTGIKMALCQDCSPAIKNPAPAEPTTGKGVVCKRGMQDQLTSGGHTCIANIDVTCVRSMPYTPAPTPHLLARPQRQRCSSLGHHAKTSVVCKRGMATSVDICGAHLNCQTLM